MELEVAGVVVLGGAALEVVAWAVAMAAVME
jgi:hypothetical protein